MECCFPGSLECRCCRWLAGAAIGRDEASPVFGATQHKRGVVGRGQHEGILHVQEKIKGELRAFHFLSIRKSN